MIEQRRLRNSRRGLQVIAAVLSVAVLLGCAERLLANIGVWGVFVGWAVAAVVATAWPLAFLVTGIGRVPRGGRAVWSTAFGLTLSSLGLLNIGWGLVMALAPEYTVGWYFPARAGRGNEIDDAAEALLGARPLIAFGVLLVVASVGVAVAVARGGSAPDDPEGSDDGSEGGPASLGGALASTAALLLVLCGALFWVISLAIGVLSMIQYDGVRQMLATCSPATGACAAEVWLANELPWVLAAGSALALVALGVAALTSSSWTSWLGDGAEAALNLVLGGIHHAGSVIAVTSAILYARWSDSTCTGRGSLRSCGARPPELSFVEEWTPWVTVWALATYAVLAYVVVFGLLAAAEPELADLEVYERPGAGGAGTEPSRSSGRYVAVYLLAVVMLLGAGWTGISSRHLASVPSESSGPWQEYVAETMNASTHPHLEEVRFEFPSGHDPVYPLLVQVTLEGAEQEMPSAEALDLVDAACAYVVSPWRSSVPETSVNLVYGAEGDYTRFVRVDCGAGHRPAVGDLLEWMEQHPAGSTVEESSIKSRADGVLETQLYLSHTSTPTVRTALTHLCSLPATEGVRRSGTLFDDTATREVSDIDCNDLEAALAEWRSHD